MDKLRAGLSVIGPEDTTVLLGDLSWALELDGAVKDFAFISAIPGRKILLKGNHDYWWSTAAKFYRFCAEHGFEDLYVLNNNCYFTEIPPCAERAAGSTRRTSRGRTTKRCSGGSLDGWRRR